ncbi:DNA internalization-related competence protein ComEC/Rec2 [Neobacillus sp. MM2021_6]|uniref:DNA internalization-related competence protein ComEC/Rec2 n=1 Tax=Bacillaceae TaxID=186817 RepID=UPI00140BD30E|nr:MULTISPECIES: DNA internalization-related competence protein ComEC/Rec2 [Bacillaceae]MBO0959433.1 DNA internalization-related competence protein ComEC/Rec2 [Neobacillus sp. MM2021_6]NHC17269.1 DNA internalization-related competence protein ComEC/Rec2 [Bacillus sp. MM2020_4]
MNGKYLYFALSALLGVLTALVMFLPFLLLTIIYLYLLTKYKRFRGGQLLTVILLFTALFLAGEWTEINHKSIITESDTKLIIEYTQDPKIDGDLLQVQAVEKQFQEKLLIRYQMKSEKEKEFLKNKSFFRCVCRVSGTMEKPAIAKNPNGFNYRSYLSSKEIYWILEMNENPLQSCSPLKSSPIMLIKQLRFSGVRFLEEHFPPEIASLSAALIFGDRNMLDPELLGDYQKTGIVHLLAISGLHVSLLIGMVFYMGIRCGLTRQFMTNFLLVLLPVYVILTGGSSSVIRAALMIFLVLITIKWKRRLKLLPLDAISLALIVCLFITPLVIFDVGFQLSFSVSYAIILSAPHILTGYQGNGVRMLITSVTAQLAALPLLLYHYFEISMIGILANLLYIPLFSFVYLPGLYVLFFFQLLFRHTPQILIGLFLKIIHLFNYLIGTLADFPLAHFIPGKPHLIILIIYLFLIFAVFYNWEAGVYSKKLFLLAAILFTVQPFWNWVNPYGEVTMIDVGQGDSILIHLPHGKGNYLIDTGGTISFAEEKWRKRSKPFEVGRDVVLPYLKGKGITQIDKLILTHGDMDHIGGALSILTELKVKQILMPSMTEPSTTELAIIKEARKQGIPVFKVSVGDQWKENKSEFFVLSPEKNFTGERNSGSIAFVARLGGVRWFFGGDLDQEGEEKIIKKYPHLTIDVLKAGHHGSKTSSSEIFIKHIKPKVALISAGENNRFGHPHQEVLDLLKETNSIIFRTDQQGAITYRFYHGKGTFSTYLP